MTDCTTSVDDTPISVSVSMIKYLSSEERVVPSNIQTISGVGSPVALQEKVLSSPRYVATLRGAVVIVGATINVRKFEDKSVHL